MHHDIAYHYRLIEMQMAKENNQPTDKSAQGRFVADCVWVIKQRISGVSSVVTYMTACAAAKELLNIAFTYHCGLVVR